jgi:hypothetical protein
MCRQLLRERNTRRVFPLSGRRPALPTAKVPGGGRSQKSEVPVFRGARGVKIFESS